MRVQRPTNLDNFIETFSASPFTIKRCERHLFQPIHAHEQVELLRILEGEGMLLVNGESYELNSNGLFLIYPNEFHRIIAINQLKYVKYHISYEWLKQVRLAKEEVAVLLSNQLLGGSRVISVRHPYYSNLLEILDEIEKEYFDRAADCSSKIRLLIIDFCKFITQYHMFFAENEKKLKKHVLNPILFTSKQIEKHIKQPWTLQELADIAGLSISRFSSLFSKIIGAPPLEYLIQLRIMHALQLLENPTIKISEVSKNSGFKNLSNFNRLFRIHTNETPSKMRKMLRVSFLDLQQTHKNCSCYKYEEISERLAR